jgi:copper transport protein
LRRLLLATALAIASAVAGAVPASAHANYVRSTPAADARLVRPPTEIRVAFSEPPDPKGSQIQVLDDKGVRWDLANTAASGEPNGLVVGLKPIGEGGYLVAWATVSSVDGHETKGSFAFVVGNGPLPSLPDVPNAAAPPTPLEVAGRALSYAGIALALGTALFGLLVHAATDPAEARRERQLFMIAAGLLVIGSAGTVLAQGDRLPPRLELLLSVRLLAGLGVVAALAGRIGAPARRYLVLGCGVVAALTATLVSHATALGNAKDMALDLIHVLSVSAWSGGLIAFLWIHLRTPSDDPEALRRTTWRFSLVALLSVSLLATAGTLQAFDRLVLIQDLVETPYGFALLAKIGLFLIVLAVAAFNLLRYGPRGDRRALIRGTAIETALVVAVFVAAGVLTALAPPAQVTGAAFDKTQHVGGLRVELVVPTSIPGRNRFVVRVQQGLTPVTNAEKVALRFTMIEHDMGESELVAAERAPGEYVATGSPTAMYGTWKVETIVRLQGRDDVRALFVVPIAQQNEQGATATALSANAYNLVVFPDPSLPVDGAPIALNIVVLDKAGTAAAGVRITGVLAPKSGQPAENGTLTATELGPGRYRIDIAGLPKGSWTMTLTIGDPANTAAYTFVVSP